ncbi:ABC transporter substrate-binding protein [Bradyrhizobium sp. 17]|uniref:ABC transporter substrate-binding protein n=1 Tax=Bradyrhizobium sp. 17 TaxID=2782649 RepID=UPI001FF9FF98|nr:polyamine ABC transporter substrate-binding protein [Bradyrhizobium sp. 17]
MNRRQFVNGVTAAGALFLGAAPFIASSRARAAERITLANWGGSTDDFMKEYWIKPFTSETGIAVDTVAGPDFAKALAQVQSNNIQWDLLDTGGGQAYQGGQLGLWEQIDTKIVDPARFVQSPPSFAVPTAIYALGIAYDPSRTKDPARTFPQLWDVKSFPGRRTLMGTGGAPCLEVPLLADGVAPSQMYPLDLDRAFKALDRIKPNVVKFWTATAECISLIQRNEADYSTAWLNRVKLAKAAGISIDFSFAQCINLTGYFTVLKGTKHKEAAMRFLDFITRPEQQAALANKLGAVPVTKGAEQKIDAEARRWLPDLNNPNSLFVDNKYWADRYQELSNSYKEWSLR